MPDDKQPAAGTTTLTEPPKQPEAEKPPEEKLFPKAEEKPAPKEPAKPEGDAEKPKPPEEPKPEAKKEEPKPQPKAPSPDANAPVDYEALKLPEGSVLSADDLAAAKKEAKENGLSLEEAQGVLEVRNDAVKSYKAQQEQLAAKGREVWKQEWTDDPDFGGDKLKESTELAKRAFDRLADGSLKTLMEQTGAGNHPAVLRLFARIGKMFSEDQLVRGGVGPAKPEKAPEDRLYGPKEGAGS